MMVDRFEPGTLDLKFTTEKESFAECERSLREKIRETKNMFLINTSLTFTLKSVEGHDDLWDVTITMKHPEVHKGAGALVKKVAGPTTRLEEYVKAAFGVREFVRIESDRRGQDRKTYRALQGEPGSDVGGRY